MVENSTSGVILVFILPKKLEEGELRKLDKNFKSEGCRRNLGVREAYIGLSETENNRWGHFGLINKFVIRVESLSHSAYWTINEGSMVMGT